MPSSQAESTITDELIICVICLEAVDKAARIFPCRHNDFHFPCLGTWLQQNRSCPLCKVEATSIRYHDGKGDSISIFHLPPSDKLQSSPRRQYSHPSSRLRSRSSRRARRESISDVEDPALRFRRRIYQRNQYSLYVGNNNFSRYRNVTPSLLTSDPDLLPRAKKWIRRELLVLGPFHRHESLSALMSNVGHSNAFRNNEFLLEYIIAILRHIDIKGSAGQAELLIREHLGPKNSRLFVHELENWLRSPFDTLQDWDDFVQYDGA